MKIIPRKQVAVLIWASMYGNWEEYNKHYDDICDELGSKTVNKSMKKLLQHGLIDKDEQECIFLTGKGEESLENLDM